MTTTLDHAAALPFKQLPTLEALPAPALRRPRPTTRHRHGDRRDRVGHALTELFTARDDLAGVSAVADVLAEDLLWSV